MDDSIAAGHRAAVAAAAAAVSAAATSDVTSLGARPKTAQRHSQLSHDFCDTPGTTRTASMIPSQPSIAAGHRAAVAAAATAVSATATSDVTSLCARPRTNQRHSQPQPNAHRSLADSMSEGSQDGLRWVDLVAAGHRAVAAATAAATSDVTSLGARPRTAQRHSQLSTTALHHGSN